MVDQLKMQDAERIDAPDLQFLANIPLAQQRQLGAGFLTNPQPLLASPRAFICSGFKPVNQGATSAKQLRVDRGTAVLSMKEDGVVSHGVFTSEGDATKIIDMSAFANGTYGIWLRFQFVEAGFANRLFWDPAVPAEFAQNIPTRKTANWNLTTLLYTGSPTPPGGSSEWLYIGDGVIGGGVLTITPKRPMFFEGTEAGSPVFSSSWGGGNDRDNDRGAYGVHDLQTFSQAVLKKLEEIQSGTSRWWTATAEPLDQKVSKSGDALNGIYTFASGGSNEVVFNCPTHFFANANFASGGVTLGTASTVSADMTFTGGALPHFAAGIRGAADIGASGGRFDKLWLDSGIDILSATGGAPQLRACGVTGGTTKGTGVFGHNTDTNKQLTLGFDSTVVGAFLQGPGSLTVGVNTLSQSIFMDSTGVFITAPEMSPDADGTDLGNGSERWFGHFLGAQMFGNITPNAANSHALGTAGLPFLETHVSNAYVTGPQLFWPGGAFASGSGNGGGVGSQSATTSLTDFLWGTNNIKRNITHVAGAAGWRIIQAGWYRISWSLLIASDGSRREITTQLLVNGGPAGTGGCIAKTDIPNVGTERYTVAHVCFVNLANNDDITVATQLDGGSCGFVNDNSFINIEQMTHGPTET